MKKKVYPERSRRAFTLMEVVIVMAVIGILAAFVVVSLGKARQKGNEARVRVGLDQIKLLMEKYYNTHGYSYKDLATTGTKLFDLDGNEVDYIGTCYDKNSTFDPPDGPLDPRSCKNLAISYPPEPIKVKVSEIAMELRKYTIPGSGQGIFLKSNAKSALVFAALASTKGTAGSPYYKYLCYDTQGNTEIYDNYSLSTQGTIGVIDSAWYSCNIHPQQAGPLDNPFYVDPTAELIENQTCTCRPNGETINQIYGDRSSYQRWVDDLGN